MRRERLTLERGERTTLPRTYTSQTTREFEKRRVERERVRARNLLLFLCVFQEKKKACENNKTTLEGEQNRKQSKPYDSPRTIAIAATNGEKGLIDRSMMSRLDSLFCVCVFVFVCLFLCGDIFSSKIRPVRTWQLGLS